MILRVSSAVDWLWYTGEEDMTESCSGLFTYKLFSAEVDVHYLSLLFFDETL